MVISDVIFEFLRSSFAGVSHKLAGDGGIDCYDFLTFKNRIFDTLVFTILTFVLILPRVARTLSLPKEWEIISYCRKRTSQRICGFRKFLLIALAIILGIEMAYKISGKTWIYLMNPCHVITVIQVCFVFFSFLFFKIVLLWVFINSYDVFLRSKPS